jgi:hypothetical protein
MKASFRGFGAWVSKERAFADPEGRKVRRYSVVVIDRAEHPRED